MKDQKKTKAQLLSELKTLRVQIAASEESDRRRKTAVQLSLEIDKKWKEGQFAIRHGSWIWDAASGVVTFRLEPRQEGEGQELDCQFRGTWKEIVHPEAFDLFVTELDSFLTNLKPSTLVLPTKNGTWLLLGGHVPNHSSGGSEIRMRGTYLDLTSFVTMHEKIHRITPDSSDIALPAALLDKITLISALEYQKTLSLLEDEAHLLIDDLYMVREDTHKKQVSILVTVLRRLLQVLRPSDAPIFVANGDMKYTYVSASMASLVGLHESDLIGRTELEVFGAPDKSLKSRWEKDFEAIEGKATLRYRKLVVRTGDGTCERQAFLVSLKLADTTLGVLFDPRWMSTGKSQDSCNEVESSAIRKVRAVARRVAKTDTVVLLTGESGVGKDHLARYIHNHSNRAEGPYFSINCAAIPPTLAESELFGYERGAHSEAKATKPGQLQLAEGGTILLNEIGELPLPLQAKLLTFLDTNKIVRVGGTREITVNARVIAATNIDLEEAVKSGKFRKDLYYRINVVAIKVPPLRDRPEDIPVLIQESLDSLTATMELPFSPRLGPTDRKKMEQYAWPGNIRELRNVLQRAIALAPGSWLRIDLPRSGSDQETEPAPVNKLAMESPQRPTAKRLPTPTPSQQLRIYKECIEPGVYTEADVAAVFHRDPSTVSKWYSNKKYFPKRDVGRPPGGERDLEALRLMIREIMG